ncbi:carbohydrate ABC transporter permease [Nonomuraea sp. KC401]|uniref:carbohydrate ABC transporter permease n=1 Tax=unclassified Nonomuraea TaxID=2593643 RepID=UPI0010FD6B66|nr:MULTISPECIES: carbohydrate ABC transporter permease [unclassified Nonomuraea]NBE98348.1 ABC transporter permease subunit [Nonomuraea sp. K271]TLF73782.1 carbohydrate ABC transporter permease [Nonomuraea sp. KC401]
MSTTVHKAPGRGWSVARVRNRLVWWVMAVITGIGALLWVYPFVWMVSASLKDQLEVFGSGLSLLPKTPVWENYARAWTDAGFGQYLLNTVIVTVCTVVLVVVRCAMAGYVIARYRFTGRKTVMVVLIATLFVPTGYTIIPVVEISQRLGLLNSLSGMVIALSGAAHVASILLYMGYFRGVPKELEEAAVIDGAGFLSVFFRVMLPLAMPVTATVTLLTFLATWNAFFLPLVFTFSRPDLRTLSVGMLAFVGENSVDWSGMAAAAVISLLPVVILFVLLQRYFVEGMAGAVKS